MTLSPFRPRPRWLAAALLALAPAAFPARGADPIDTLSPAEAGALKQALRQTLLRRRTQLEDEGAARIRGLDPEALKAYRLAARLDPHDPDPKKRADAVAALKREIEDHPDVAPYLGFAKVNGLCEEQAAGVVRGVLERTGAEWVRTAKQQKSALLEKLGLADFAEPGRATERLAEDLYRRTQEQFGFARTALASLPEGPRKALLERAAELGGRREKALVDAARARLEQLARDPRVPWPVVKIDSDAVKTERIAETREILFQAAGLTGKARLEPLEAHGRELAAAWFEGAYREVVRGYEKECLDKLERFKATVGQMKRKQTQDATRVPVVPELAARQSQEEHLREYVCTVLKSLHLDADRALQFPQVRERYTNFLREELVAPALAHYKERDEEIVQLVAGMRRGGAPAPVLAPRTPAPGEPPGPQATVTKGTPGVRQGEKEAMLEDLRRLKAARDRVSTVANQYRMDGHRLPAEALRRLPEEVARRLDPLADEPFASRTELEKAMAGRLPVEDGRFIPELLDAARQHHFLVSPNSPNTDVVAAVQAEILRQAGFENREAIPADVAAFAQSQAEKIVQAHAEQVKAHQDRARELGEQMKDQRFEPILGRRLAPGAFSREGRAAIVRKELLRRYPEEPTQVREQLAQDLERIAQPEFEKARTEMQNIVRKIFWVGGGEAGMGPVRDEVIPKAAEADRRGAIETAIRAALRNRPDGRVLEEVAEQPEGRSIVEDHVNQLLEHIKHVPPPETAKAFDEALRQTALGKDNLPSREKVLASRTAPERQKLVADALEQAFQGVGRFERFLPGQTFKKKVAARAGELVAQAENPGAPEPVASAPPAAPPQSPPQLAAPAAAPGVADPAPAKEPAPGPAAPAPAQSVPPPRAAAPRVIACTLRVEAPDASDRCHVSFFCEKDRIRPVKNDDLFTRRDTRRNLEEGVSRVRAILDDELPPVILAAFKDAEGQEAQFDVRFEMVGTMLPQGLPRLLIGQMDDFFGKLHARNPLIKPNLTEVRSRDSKDLPERTMAVRAFLGIK